MKPAKKLEYSDTPAYDKLVNLMRQRAVEGGLNMSDTEIHRSARNLMGYVEFMIRANRKELLADDVDAIKDFLSIYLYIAFFTTQTHGF